MIDLETIGIAFETGGLEKGTRALGEAEKAAHKTADAADKVGEGAKRASGGMEIAAQAAKALAAAFVAVKMADAARSLIEAQQATEKLHNSLQYAVGSAANVAKEMEYLRNVTRAIGIDFSSSAQAFAKFSAATKTSGFSASETKTIFEGVAGAAAKMGLSAEETSGVFLALSQMASKGTVSAEELRGQLAERLPGAFAIAAKSMGVTQRELGKLLETGQLMASDFLPKFGQALKDEFQTPLTSLTQEINRLNSAWDIWKGSLADADGGGFKFLTNGLNESSAAMRTLGKEAGIVQKLLVAIGGFQAGAVGVGKFDTQKLQQDAMARLEMVVGGRRAMEGKNLNYLQQEQLRDLVRQEKELRDTLLQLAGQRGKETFKLPDIAGEYSAQQAKKAEAFKSYMQEVQGEKEKQVAKENERWNALKAVIGTSGADYEKALEAHNAKIAEINKKSGKSKDEKQDMYFHEENMIRLAKEATAEIEKREKATLKADTEYEAFTQKRMAGIAAETESLLQQAKAAEFELQTIGLSAEQLAVLTARRYDEQIAIQQAELDRLSSIDARGEEAARINAEIHLIEQKIDALNRLKNTEITKPKLQEQAREWQRFADDIERSLTDALMRGFESGKSFGENFVDSLKNSLKTSALKIVINYVTNGAGNLVGTLGNAAINGVLGTSGNNGGAGNNWLGTASNLNTAYSAYNTAVIGYQYATGAMSGANAAGTLFANATGTGLDGLLATNSAFGTAAATETGWASLLGEAAYGAWVLAIPAIAGAIKSYGTRKAYEFDGVQIKGDYSGDNFTGAAATKWNADGGWWQNGDEKKVWTQLSADPALLLSQIFPNGTAGLTLPSNLADIGKNSLSVKMNLSEAIAAYEAGRASVPADNQYSDSYMPTDGGGLIYAPVGDGMPAVHNWATRGELGSKTPRLSTDPAMLGALDSAIDAIFAATKASFKGLADQFDDADLVAKINAFSAAVDIDTNSGDISKVLANLTDTVNKQMAAAFLPAIETLRQTAADGSTEAWSATLARVMTEVSGVTRLLDLMGTSLGEAFGKNNTNGVLTLVDGLAGMFGGIDNLNQSFSAYYANFFTAEEQRAQALEDIGKSFKALNLTMPQTRDGFRDLVEAQDLTTVSGQATFRALMDLQGGFAQLTPVVQTLADAQSNLRTAYDRQASEMQATVDRFGDYAKNLKSFRQSLLLGSLSPLDAVGRYDQAKAQYQDVSRRAQLGDTDAIESLQSVSEGFLEASRSMFASGDAYNADFASVIAATEGTESLAERQSRIAADSLSALTAQVSALVTLNNSVLGIGDAITQAVLATIQSAGAGSVTSSNIASMYQDILGRSADQGGLDYWTARAKDTSGSDLLNEFVGAATSAGNTDAAAATAWASKTGIGAPGMISKMYRDMLGRAPDVAGMGYWIDRLQSGTSPAEIAAGFAASDEYKNSHATGLERVPYDGYKATLHRDEAVVDAQSTRALTRYFGGGGGSGALIAEFKALTAEFKSLREEVKQLRSEQQGQHREAISANYDANDRAAQKVVSGQQETAWRQQNKPRYAA